MVTDLKLKGNDLLIYAIIYGFNLDDDSDFHGSLDYLQTWTNSTKQGVLKSLRKLINLGLVNKVSCVENGKKCCRYTVNTQVNKVEQTGEQSLPDMSTKFTSQVNKVYPDGKQSLHNNKIYNTNNNKNNNIYKPEAHSELKGTAFPEPEDCKKNTQTSKKTKTKAPKEKTEAQLKKELAAEHILSEYSRVYHEVTGFDFIVPDSMKVIMTMTNKALTSAGSEENAIKIINNARNDKWILNKGFSFYTIFAESIAVKLLNAVPQVMTETKGVSGYEMACQREMNYDFDPDVF